MKIQGQGRRKSTHKMKRKQTKCGFAGGDVYIYNKWLINNNIIKIIKDNNSDLLMAANNVKYFE